MEFFSYLKVTAMAARRGEPCPESRPGLPTQRNSHHRCENLLILRKKRAFFISLSSYIEDMRMMPREVQVEVKERREDTLPSPVNEPTDDVPSMGLTEAVQDVVDILRGQPDSEGDGADSWDRIVRIIAKHDSLPNSDIEVIEKAISDAYGIWSDVERRAIWYETDSGLTDDDEDDAFCDTSFNGIGYALQVEMLDEVTRAAWQEAEDLRKAAAKRPRRMKSRAE